MQVSNEELLKAQYVLVEREAALRSSEGRMRTMFEQAPLGLAPVDSSGDRIREANAKLVEIAGRESEADLAAAGWVGIVHPEDVTERHLLGMSLRSAQAKLDSAQEVAKVGFWSYTIADERSRAVLLDAVSRVQSMMVLYNKLYQSAGFKSVSVLTYLPTLINEILENFPNSASIKVWKIIDDFTLDAKMLQPLGIIINELLTNIMKYAFAGIVLGVITITASLKGKRVILGIEDNGNGMPESIDFANSPGFGLMLVDLLTRQMHGTIRIDRERGTKITLEFDA